MVRLIDENRVLAGDLPLEQALERARAAGLDLVEVSPNASPPVVRIVDLGRYRYEQNKKKSAPPAPSVKEVQFRPTIAEGDYALKRKHITEFLAKGSRCRVSMRFRGREITHAEIGERLLMRLIEELAEVGHLDGRISREGKQMSLMLAPGARRAPVAA